jgi:uncharacterized protein (TIGR00369 family)
MTHPESERRAREVRRASAEAMNAYNATVPFNAWLGAQVVSADHEGVRLKVPWRVEFGGAPGMTHGGILAGIIDLSAYMALMAEKGGAGPTIDMRIDYHRSVVNGTLFTLARLLRVGATISTVEVVVHDAEQRLIASGRCVFLSQGRKRAPDAMPGDA